MDAIGASVRNGAVRSVTGECHAMHGLTERQKVACIRTLRNQTCKGGITRWLSCRGLPQAQRKDKAKAPCHDIHDDRRECRAQPTLTRVDKAKAIVYRWLNKSFPRPQLRASKILRRDAGKPPGTRRERVRAHGVSVGWAGSISRKNISEHAIYYCIYLLRHPNSIRTYQRLTYGRARITATSPQTSQKAARRPSEDRGVASRCGRRGSRLPLSCSSSHLAVGRRGQRRPHLSGSRGRGRH